MRKSLFQLALMLLCGSWGTEAFALWTRADAPITTAAGLKPDMKIVLTNVCAEKATTKYVFAPDLRYAVHNDKVVTENVIVLEAAGANPYTGEPMYYLRSEFNNLYFSGGDGFTVNQENALPITFGSAQKHTRLEKGEGWAPDAPVWPNEGKIPAWDWKNGDALTIVNYTSATTANGLYHIWGWDNYPKAQWGGVNPVDNVNEGTAVNPWYAYEVVYEDNPVEDLNDLLTKHEDAGYGDFYVAGTGVGYCDSTAVAAYKEAIETAGDLLVDPNSSDEQLKAAAANIEATFKAMTESLSMPRDGGCYYIVSDFTPFETVQKVKKAWFKDDTTVKWTTIDRNNISFVFRFIKQDYGTYAIQSLKDDTYLNGFTSVSATPATTQSLWPDGHGTFYIKDGAKPTNGSTDCYHVSGHSNGNGVTGTLAGWYAHNYYADWHLEEFTDIDKIDEMKAAEAQRRLTAAFSAALSEARADSAAGYWTKFYIKRVDQLSTNAPSAEGPIAGLIDNNNETFFHTSWRERVGEPHYLQVALDEPLQKIAVYCKKRYHYNKNRPTQITILASNDGTNFNEVAMMPEAPDTLPTAADIYDYYSPKAIDLGAPYKYIRFRVDSTDNSELEPADPDNPDAPRYPFFSFSEFNLSGEGFPVDPESIAMREDMKPVYAALKAAIDEALAKDPATVTQTDVDAIVAANEAFNKAYPDTTLLSNAISQTDKYASQALVVADGQEAAMGMCTDQSKVDDMAAAVTTARAALDANARMTRAEIDAHVADLTAANKAFFDAVVMPEPNKWYFMESKCTEREDGTLGSIVYPSSNAIGAQVVWGSSIADGGLMNVKYLWRFVPVAGKEDVYAVQNMGTGYYLGEDHGSPFLLSDTIVEFKMAYIAGGELSIIQNKEGTRPAHAAASGKTLVPWNSGKGSASAWTFVEASADEQIMEATLDENRGDIFCLPYDITGEFYGYNFDEGIDEAEVKAYTITDARYDENGDITEIGVTTKEIGDEGIPAGTPFLLIAGDINAEAGVSLQVDLGLIFDSEISTVAKEDNGMIGLMSTTTVKQKGIGYFSLADGLQRSEKSISITGQTGYIDGHKVKASGEAEFYIPVKNGVITEIKQAVKDSQAIVNVYTVDGKLLRKNVKNADALKGLQKGLYVVNGKVYSVK